MGKVTPREEMTMLRRFLIGAMTSIVLLLAGCARYEEATLSSNPPISKVDVHSFRGALSWKTSERIDIYLAQNAHVGEIVDLRVFGGLEPEANPETRYGKAHSSRRDDYGMPWYRYLTPVGYVEVGCEKRLSGGSEEVVSKAPCFPVVDAHTDLPMESIFREPVAEQIRTAKRMRHSVSLQELTIRDEQGEVIIYCRLRGEHIERLGLGKQVDR